ncbi:ABC transporter permease [Streptococcus hyointestinalis]|uniref:ABC transporter permease n=1 Tax=Streptococcus hyointestinalis TaxID=1337 RepID=UPI0013DEE33F|nr:ABC transporter permease [Streptococcus hyointestinalis]
MTMFKALMWNEWLLTKRNLISFVTAIILPSCFFLFFSQGVGTTPAEQTILRDYLMTMTAFASLSLVFFTLPFSLVEDRKTNRLRLLKHTPVPMPLYYLAKVLRIVLFYLVAIVVSFSVGHFVRGVDLPTSEWLMSAVLLMFAMLCFLPFGLLLSTIKSSEALSTAGNLLYIGLAMLGGMWMPLSMFPDWLQAISKCTPTYHFYHLVTSYLKNGTIINTSFFVLIAYALGALLLLFWTSQKKEFGDR